MSKAFHARTCQKNEVLDLNFLLATFARPLTQLSSTPRSCTGCRKVQQAFFTIGAPSACPCMVLGSACEVSSAGKVPSASANAPSFFS